MVIKKDMKHACCSMLYSRFDSRQNSGYANIKSENRNAEKQCSFFNNLLDKNHQI